MGGGATKVLPEASLPARLAAWSRKPVHEKLDSLVYRVAGIVDRSFERRYGLEFDGHVATADLVTDSVSSRAHAVEYQPYHSVLLRNLVREGLRLGIAYDRFVDVGSGKGKVCIYVAREFAFPEVVGVDFSRPLVDVAETNRRRSHLAHVRFEHADAARWKLPPGPALVFLYNPFDAEILEGFLGTNQEHFRRYGSAIAYANDVHRASLARSGFEMLFRNHQDRISLHRSSAAPPLP